MAISAPIYTLQWFPVYFDTRNVSMKNSLLPKGLETIRFR